VSVASTQTPASAWTDLSFSYPSSTSYACPIFSSFSASTSPSAGSSLRMLQQPTDRSVSLGQCLIERGFLFVS
jgi:hypothetical protein